MMKSDEFIKYFKEQLKDSQNNAIELGIIKAKKFNDDRIDRFKDYELSRVTFKNELDKLEDRLNLLRSTEKINRMTMAMDENEVDGYLNKSNQGQIDSKEEKPLKVHFDNLLISMVDPALFKDYLQELEKRVKINLISLEIRDHKEDETNLPYLRRSKTEVQRTIIGEIKFEEENSSMKNYHLTVRDYLRLFFMYIPGSNTQNLVFVLCFINHYHYASLESVILPLSVVGYAMLESPRPPPFYFKLMLYYLSGVFMIKFCFQQEIWPYITKNSFPDTYHDPFKTGLNSAKNTHSETLFNYILWDALLMIVIVFHLYYLRRVGLFEHSEYDIETFEQAEDRREREKSRHDRDRLESQDSAFTTHQSCLRKIEKLVTRLIPTKKEEKPGKDFYFQIFFVQLVILIYIFFTFTKMEGFSQDISQSIRANQFQGRMVIALIIQFVLIIIDRYLYVRKTSQALKEDLGLQESQDSGADSVCSDTPAMLKSRSLYDPLYESVDNIYDKNKQMFLSPEISTFKRHSVLKSGSKDDLIVFPKFNPQTKKSRWNKDLLFKVLSHIFIMLLVHVLVFWYFPISGNYSLSGKLYCDSLYNDKKCNDFEVNIFIEWFYVIYAIYFMIVSLQIRHGLPSFRKVSFPLMRTTSLTSYRLFKVYLVLPFLFELRTLMDWTFTKTSLDIYQWFKFEDINAQLYMTQCVYK